MIDRVTINYNNSNSPKNYWWLNCDGDGNPRKLLPEEIKFTNGLNIIVGNNGCGKTTLLKLIADLCLINGLPEHNFWDIVGNIYPKADWLFDKDYSVVQDVVQVVNNFDCPIYQLKNLEEKIKFNFGQINNFNDFKQYWCESTMSKGQKMMSGLIHSVIEVNERMKDYSWKNMFPDNWQKMVNETWALGYDKLYEYIETNNHSELERRVTILLDEPDEGLDIDNLKLLKDFLLRTKENTQVIVILHNQLLIRALADEANVIELSENYLQKIKEF